MRRKELAVKNAEKKVGRSNCKLLFFSITLVDHFAAQTIAHGLASRASKAVAGALREAVFCVAGQRPQHISTKVRGVGVVLCTRIGRAGESLIMCKEK